MKLSPSSIPAPEATRVLALERLDGGLNLYEESYRLAPDQSPQMKNLLWRDGALASRRGQKLLTSLPGPGLAAYEQLWEGKLICHAGDSLWALDPASGEGETLCGGLGTQGGGFFRYDGALYYKCPGAYKKITAAPLAVQDVAAYVPVTLINADPATGAGDLYQPENRLSPRKTVWYNAVEGVTDYRLPVTGAELVEVLVDGEAAECELDPATGLVRFAEAPPVQSPPVNNTVRITYSLPNPEAEASIMDCGLACVYGGDTRLCVVLAGSEAQPRAYFWNGGHAAMDPGYFPMEQYNLAPEAVTGFGRQQGKLLIFSAGGLSRAALSLVEIDGRERLQLPCVSISSTIGCALPGSIRSVENHLLFCSHEGGVYRVQDTSAAGETNLLPLSRQVNGGGERPGLLADLAACGGLCASLDDGERYWLAMNGRVWLWDYALSGPTKPSWFLFTNIEATAFVREGEELLYLAPDGRICAFYEGFTDFGAGIEREYVFAPALPESHRLKDVDRVLLTVSSSTDSLLRLEYLSDHGRREEPVPIRAYAWRLVPRNLGYRMLACRRWTKSALRRPACRHAQHFAMRLYNSEPGQDMSIVSARVFFRYRMALR